MSGVTGNCAIEMVIMLSQLFPAQAPAHVRYWQGWREGGTRGPVAWEGWREGALEDLLPGSCAGSSDLIPDTWDRVITLDTNTPVV